MMLRESDVEKGISPFHFFPFATGQPDNISIWEFIRIIAYRLVNTLCFHSVQYCHIAIQYYTPAANGDDLFFYLFQFYDFFHVAVCRFKLVIYLFIILLLYDPHFLWAGKWPPG
jgi:hypothetical protein